VATSDDQRLSTAQDVYIITLPVDGLQLQSLILTATGPETTATLSYSPASSDGQQSKTSAVADEVKSTMREDGTTCTAGRPDGDRQKVPCSGLDTLAAVADRLRQEMLDQEAAADYAETKLNGLPLLCFIVYSPS